MSYVSQEYREHAEKYRSEANKFLEENIKPKHTMKNQKFEFDKLQRERKRSLKKVHQDAIGRKDNRLKELKKLVNEKNNKCWIIYRTMMLVRGH